MAVESKQTQYHFGDVLVQTERREILVGGASQEVEPRVFDLLVYLIGNRDRVVTKEELREAVWKPAVVSETALTRAVMKARRSVGDDPNEQQIIKTVRGHGYRFVAALAATDPAGSRDDQPEPKPGDRRPAFLTAAAIAVALAAVLAFVLNRPPAVDVELGAEPRIAILPFQDNTDDPELQWASLGLMSYAGKLLESTSGLATVGASRILGLTENFQWQGDSDPASLQPIVSKLRSVYGATHVVSARLFRQGQLLRIQASVLGPDNSSTQYVTVGDDGTKAARSLVREIAQLIQGRVSGSNAIAPVSESDFVNEAYARGLNMALEGRCEAALTLYDIALKQDSESFPVRLHYAHCARIQGDWERSQQMTSDLLVESSTKGDSRELARVHMQLGVIYNRTGKVTESEAQYRSALAVAERVGDQDLSGDILTNWSIVVRGRGDLDFAEELLGRATVAYTAAGRTTPNGSVLSSLANIAIGRRNLEEADGLLDQAIAAFQEVGDRRREAMMINNRGLVRRHQGRRVEAAVLHEQSMAIREEIGDEVGVGRILGMLSGLYLDLGQYEDARDSAQKALPIARKANDRLFEGTALAQLGTAQQRLGELAEARSSFQAAVVALESMEDRPRVLDAELRLASLLHEEGDSQRAMELAELWTTEALENNFESTALQGIRLQGDIKLSQGDIAGAEAQFQRILDRLKGTDWSSTQAATVTVLARLYLDDNRPKLAEPLVGLLSQHTPSFPGLLLQARFHADRGDTKAALEHMRQAKSLAGKRWREEHETLLQGFMTRT